METKTNTGVVMECYENFGKGDIPAVLNSLTDDVTWIDPGYPDVHYAGERHGKGAVGEFFMKMNEAVEFTKFEPRSFISEGDKVVVAGYFEGKTRATGKVFETDWAMIWTVREGKVTHYQAYADTNNIAKALKD